jgi:ADP-ribosylglycohydrolase
MLIEIAIADAYGAGFEFSSERKVILYNDLSSYSRHDLYGFSAKYTDDTQMTIAIAELMLNNEEYTSEIIADKFIECFKRDQRLGYSKGFYQLLLSVESGFDLINIIKPNSERNGAAMRSVPIGFFKEKNRLLEFAKMQAQITHNTSIAIQSSCAIALACHFGIHYKGKLLNLEKFLEVEGYAEWDFDWDKEVSIKAFDTVSAAFSCLIKNSNLKDLLQSCVALRGDTDSVASIAVGLACCFDEYEKNLPLNLIKDLDEPTYGILFLGKLDEELRKKFTL